MARVPVGLPRRNTAVSARRADAAPGQGRGDQVMIAAIYARKSTEQRVTDDAKSVTRQVELARDFATSKGWQVAEEHVYRDDGISGAEFKDRPGLASLLLAVKSSPRPFDVVVAMDESRLGRDQFQTAYLLQQIADAGV